MRILIDTNILFSAVLKFEGTPRKAFNKAKIRYIDDRTILRAAVKAKADIILTGDKDLLESGITSPQIMTAREFLELNDCE